MEGEGREERVEGEEWKKRSGRRGVEGEEWKERGGRRVCERI